MPTLYDSINTNAESAHDLVGEQFTITQNWATTMLNQTLTFLNSMADIGSFTVSPITLTHRLPSGLDITEFDGVVPTDLILNYSSPTKPTLVISPLDGIFLFSGQDYTSSLSSDLVEQIRDLIADGGTGLSASVEDAIIARAQARVEAENVALYNETENYFAARGWTLPPGMLSGRLLEIQKEITRNNNQLSYEVLIKQAELADLNTRHNKEIGVQLELGLRQHYIQNTLKDLEVAKASADALINEFNTKAEKARLEIELYRVDYEAVVALINAQVQEYIGKVQAYQVKAAAYRDITNAKIAVYQAEAAITRIEADIELGELDAQLRAFLGIADLTSRAAEGSARIAAQIAAGAMSAVNAGVSFSYGASQGASGSYTDSDSYSESVITQEIYNHDA